MKKNPPKRVYTATGIDYRVSITSRGANGSPGVTPRGRVVPGWPE